MYIKFHRSTMWKMISSPAPIRAPLSNMSAIFPSLSGAPTHFSVNYDGSVHVDNHLNHKVLLDLGVLQTSLVGQELPREEPPLAGHINVFLFFQLFLELCDGVGDAGCQAHVLS